MQNSFTDRLCTVSIPEIKLKVTLFYIGNVYVAYKMWHNGKLLFKGTDYKPSQMLNIDSLDSVIDLLGFFSLQKGDTDDDYFKNYSSKQMEWTKTNDCEILSMYVSDFSEEKKKTGIRFYQ